MNGEHDERNPLELATAQRLPVDAELSAESKELRDVWLALTQVLPQHKASDTAAFAAHMASELTAEPVALHPKGRLSKAMIMVGAIGATAVALLLALSVWMANRPGAKEELAEGGPTQASLANSMETGRSQAESRWDDPLDAQIARMQEDMARLRAGGPNLDSSLSALDQQLADLADDLDASSL